MKGGIYFCTDNVNLYHTTMVGLLLTDKHHGIGNKLFTIGDWYAVWLVMAIDKFLIFAFQQIAITLLCHSAHHLCGVGTTTARQKQHEA